jgi:hypothetical protein
MGAALNVDEGNVAKGTMNSFNIPQLAAMAFEGADEVLDALEVF